jgi:glycosyltransferase involved in cell wall biosynthesis
MRILILVDDAADLEGPIQYVDDEGWVKASPRRDVQKFVPRLDPNRVQPIVYTIRGSGEQSLNARRWLDLSAARRLRQVIREQDIELIHAMGQVALLYTAIIGRLAGIPTLASYYGPMLADRQDRLATTCRWFVHQLARWGIDRMVVPSELASRAFIQTRYPPERLDVVYPGVEIAPDSENVPASQRAVLGLSDKPLVTMVAPMIAGQGYEVMIDAMPRLLERVPEAQLAFVGSGPLMNDLKHKAVSHKPPLPITWLGAREDIREIIAVSDAVVVHPRREGIPHAIIEAAAVGKPLVTSRVAGATEVIVLVGTTTGLLVTPGDGRDLAIQLARLLTQPKLATQLGTAAKQRARECFSLEAQRDAMTSLYEATIYASR